MLDTKIIKNIEDFVYSKPRSIQEIAQHLSRNWRTADRYVDEINKEFGTISTRVFREGTRGALKIVFWSSFEKISHSVFQKILEDKIKTAKRKDEFSAFDIFQFVSEKNKKVTIEKEKEESLTNLKDFVEILEKTNKQLLIFSGNLSFINLKNSQLNIFEEFDKLVKKGVKIKVICRVDIVGKDNIEKFLSLNFKNAKESVEIRHNDQPLRAIISDNKFFRIKEVQEPTGKIKELDKKIFIFYTIKDQEWVEWIARIFWKMFSESIDSNKRLTEINRIF